MFERIEITPHGISIVEPLFVERETEDGTMVKVKDGKHRRAVGVGDFLVADDPTNEEIARASGLYRDHVQRALAQVLPGQAETMAECESLRQQVEQLKLRAERAERKAQRVDSKAKKNA